MDQPTPVQPSSASVIREHTKSARVVRVVDTKKPRSVRITDAGFDRITERAARADVDVSHMLRRMLAYADRHMPEGWVPGERSRS